MTQIFLKRLSAVALLCLFSATIFSQPANQKELRATVLRQANDMGDLLISKKYGEFLKYTHPRLFELAGGREHLQAEMEKTLTGMEADGTRILSVKMGEPSDIVTAEGELQCTVPQKLEIKVNGGKLIAESTLVGISLDKGANWYFLDVGGKDMEMIRQLVPSVSDKLVIPEKTDPQYIEGKGK